MIIKNPDGSETFYQEAGDPTHEPLLLLHGLGADHEMWHPQIREFAAHGYFVLAPDMLGHGQSSKVQTLSLRNWEEQINALLAHKGLKSCTLIGVSMGGVIAQFYAMRNPQQVNRLILADTFGELKTRTEKALGQAQIIGLRLYKLLGPGMLARGMAMTYKAPFAALARDYFRRQSRHVDFDQLILARKAINRIDAIHKIDGERVPTLVMVGDQFGDTFIAANRKIAAGIKGAKFVVLQEAMDPSNLVNPRAFNREVLAFLKAR